MRNITLPQELSSYVGSENKDFVVKSNRAKPLKKSFHLILLGTIWTAIISVFVFMLLVPLLQGKEVHFEANGVPMVAGPGNLKPIIIPAIIISFLLLAGVGMIFLGIYSIFKKGGYFIGTPTRLICFQNGNIKSIDWEQFSGNIRVNGDAQKGNISLEMRTGKMINSKNNANGYIPNIIYILQIPNVFEVEQICRKRIKENDPTPPTTKYNIT